MRAELINLAIEVTFSMIIHFVGAFFFLLGAFDWIFGYGTVQILPLVMMLGIVGMIGGILLGIDAGKKLKSKYLAATSLAYLIVATSWIYSFFSMTFPIARARARVLEFLPHILLGIVTLDIAFLIGYFIAYFKNKRLQNAPH